jgi:DNA-binding transcriptional regulator GbsR (MarR family)
VNDAEAAFVDAMAGHLYRRGLQRMPARVWSWLLISDPPEQTAEQLAHELHASRGAISTAVRDLGRARLLQRTRNRGDRRDYFSTPPAVLRRLISGMGPVLTEGREIADEGLALLAGRSNADRDRLQELRDVYSYYEREWPSITERYLRGRHDGGAAIGPRTEPPTQTAAPSVAETA